MFSGFVHRMLEENLPEQSVTFYKRAADLAQIQDKSGNASEMFDRAGRLLVKMEKYACSRCFFHSMFMFWCLFLCVVTLVSFSRYDEASKVLEELLQASEVYSLIFSSVLLDRNSRIFWGWFDRSIKIDFRLIGRCVYPLSIALIDWLIDWLIDYCSIDWLIDWFRTARIGLSDSGCATLCAFTGSCPLETGGFCGREEGVRGRNDVSWFSSHNNSSGRLNVIGWQKITKIGRRKIFLTLLMDRCTFFCFFPCSDCRIWWEAANWAWRKLCWMPTTTTTGKPSKRLPKARLFARWIPLYVISLYFFGVSFSHPLTEFFM